MRNTFTRTLLQGFGLGLSAVTTIAAVAGAPSAPPVKTGLWEVTTTRQDESGQTQPGMEKAAAAMKDMPPEMREQMSAMMKARGFDMSAGGGGAIRMCLNKDSFDRGQWQGMQGDCTTTYSAQSGSSWKWHSTCPSMKSESDGEAHFINPENYNVKIMGRPKTMVMTMTAKWLGSNCGDIKPVTPASMK
jgi:hypothetical protein